MAGSPPRRAIRSAEQRIDGVILTLECGHTMWHAGKVTRDYHTAEDGYATIDTAHCRIGPCYRLGVSMGKS